MKCPNCNNELNDYNECELCGYKKKSGQGFLNYKVYLVSVAVILVGILAMKFMPSFTIANSQNGTGEQVTIANQELLQPQLAVAYGGVVASDDDNILAAKSDGLYRYSQGFQDGELISSQVINYLVVDDNYLYYCDEYFDFYRVDKEFMTTPEKLLTNIYYPIISAGNLYYQDDSDNESVYKLDLSTLEKVKLNDEPSYSLMVVAGNVYYMDDNQMLKVIDSQNAIATLVSSAITSFLVSEDKIYYTSTSGLWQHDGNNQQDALLLGNEYADVMPFLMLNVYQNKLVFVCYQGIVMYDQGQIEIISSQINFTKFVVLKDQIITIDDQRNYNIIDNSQTLEGSMEV